MTRTTHPRPKSRYRPCRVITGDRGPWRPTAATTPSLTVRARTERLRFAMRFALTCYGTRGDIEPSVAVGRELLRRGHEVRMGVPPDLVEFSEAAGLATVTYGLDTEAWLERYRNFWTSFFGNFWKVQELVELWREYWEPVAQCWAVMKTTAT